MIWTWVIVGVVVALAVLLCLALAVASFSFDNYRDQLQQMQGQRNSYGISTLEYVGQINSAHFGGRLKLAPCQQFQDHYSRGVIALSQSTMNSSSLASLAIVSHELGHARQDAAGSTLKKHWAMRKAGRVCGLFFLPTLIVGIVLMFLWVFGVLTQMYVLVAGAASAGIGIAIFCFAILLKYREIQIEKQASDFALEFLEEYLIPPEIEKCKKFLKAARLTYWASLIRTLLSWTMLAPKDNMFK